MKHISKKIIGKLQNDFINTRGLISSEYPPTSKHLLNHFNDYAPFLLFYGYKDFVEKQITVGLQETQYSLIPKNDRIISFEQDEWLGGLYAYFLQTRSEKVYRIIEASVQFLYENLVDDGLVRAFYNRRSQRCPNVFDPRTGALLEVLLDMDTHFQLASQIALDCLDRIIEWVNEQEQRLMPNLIYYRCNIKHRISMYNPIKAPNRYFYPYVHGWRSQVGDFLFNLPFSNYIKLAKQNSNLIHAFIRAYKISSDKKYLNFVLKWHTDFTKNMYFNGRCSSFYKYKNNRRSVKLSHNHPILEVCLELYILTGGKRFLDMAVEIAEYWLSIKLPNNLFPAFEDKNYAFIDDQTDMLVSFVRLSALLEEDKYLYQANALFENIIEGHLTEDGLTTYSGTRSGKPVEPVIHPKFNGLFLKAGIALENRKKILDEDLWLLLRDR